MKYCIENLFLESGYYSKMYILSLKYKVSAFVNTFLKLCDARIWILFTEKRSDLSGTN